MRVDPEIDGTGDAPATGLGAAVISARSRSLRRAETMGAAGSANTSAPRRTTGQSASGARADDAADHAHAGLRTAAGAANSSGVSRNAARALDTSSHARYRANTDANAPPPTFRVLQEWEGYVVDVGTGEFTARPIDLTAGESHEREEAAIPMAVISEGDVNLAVPGGVFRWLVGHEHSSKGLRRVSRIVFRDLSVLTQADIDSGKAWALGIARSLESHVNTGAADPDRVTTPRVRTPSLCG